MSFVRNINLSLQKLFFITNTPKNPKKIDTKHNFKKIFLSIQCEQP